jgi:tetratricopeptide (TPR) repeat protein
MTATGAVLGTPAYMAPEQIRGEAADARSDQFSFCVALWEAVMGARPFDAAAASERLTLIARGVPTSPRRTGIEAALKRGFAARQEDRFPSMSDLLSALEPRQGWGRRALYVLAALLLPLVVIVGRSKWHEEQLNACMGAGDPAAPEESRSRGERVRAAFRGLGADPSEVIGALDRYAVGWHQLRQAFCAARDAQSAELRDLRMACLDQRAEELRAMTELFSRADTQLVARAPSAVAGLSDLSSCSSVVALRAPIVAPAAKAAAVQQLRLRLARIRPLGLARRFTEARPLAAQAVSDARALGYAPLEAECWLEAGLLEDDAPKEGERLFKEAVWAAESGRHLSVLVEAWNHLAFDAGYLQQRFADADAYARHAVSVLDGLGHDTRLEAQTLRMLAILRHGEGKHDEAEKDFQRAIALYQGGPRPPEEVQLLTALGWLRDDQGRLEEGLATFQRAEKLSEQLNGPGHTETAQTLLGEGDALMRLHRLDEARRVDERAAAIFANVTGTRSPEYGLAIMNLANVIDNLGESDRASALLRQALTIREGAFGADSQQVAEVLMNLGSVLLRRKQLAETEPLYRRALAIEEAKLGATNPGLIDYVFNLGGLLREMHRPEEAAKYLQRALELKEKAYGREHEEVATSMRELGIAYREMGDVARARPLLERALELHTRQHSVELAATQYELATTLGPSERERARKLAKQAREAFAHMNDPAALAEIDGWLAKH